MKEINQECLNLSFNSSYDQSDHTDLDTSQFSDNKSVLSHKSVASILKGEKDGPKSDFSKKKNLIYENTELVAQIESEAKKEEEKLTKQRKLQ